MHIIRQFFSTLCTAKSFFFSQISQAWTLEKTDLLAWLIAAIFTVIFLPYSFIMLEDVSLLIALEVDPGSIMKAINSLYEWPFYNMHNGYHSQFYGWTYFAINFFVVLPVKILKEMTGSDSHLVNIAIRMTLFSIGLLSVTAAYFTMKYIFRSRVFAFIGALLLMFSCVSSPFYTVVHPESTGVFFSILGVYCLFRFIDAAREDAPKWYIAGLTALVLASLSKQLFFFTSIPVLILFCLIYAEKSGISFSKFLKTRDFGRFFTFTFILSLLILFFIHPYAFLQFGNFYQSQFSTIFDHTQSANTMPLGKAFFLWWEKILENAPLFTATFITAPAALIIALKDKRISRLARLLFITNLISVIILTLTVTCLARLFPGFITYLYPIYPFVVIHLMAVLAYISRVMTPSLAQKIVLILLAYFIILSLGHAGAWLKTSLDLRSAYKETVTYKAYDYISSEIPEGSKIANDHFVAVPDIHGLKSCHYWNDCSRRDLLDAFDPDYIILNSDYIVNDKVIENTQNLLDYIQDRNFVLSKSLSGPVIYGPDVTISVYKRK